MSDRPDDRESVASALQVIYDWDYAGQVDELRTLYTKALDSQWISLRRLDWESEVDADALSETPMMGGIPIEEMRWWKELPDEKRKTAARASAAITLSSFLHGEQGALFVASQLVNAVPHLDGKFYAATQTVDEARHVEVFSGYLQKIGGIRPILPALKSVLDKILATDDWKQKAVGMNIVLEGLALFSFRDLRNRAKEPLLQSLLTLVSQDEARHTAFGILYLTRLVGELSEKDKADLEDFGFETARVLTDARRSLTLRDSVFDSWAEAGIGHDEVREAVMRERSTLREAAIRRGTRGGALGSFVLPTMERIGLFSDRIRGHFDQLFRELSSSGKGLGDRMGELPDDLEA